MKSTLTDIEEFIKENYEPVENKPGYVWLSKRNLRIIKIETLVESLKTYSEGKGGIRNEKCRRN